MPQLPHEAVPMEIFPMDATTQFAASVAVNKFIAANTQEGAAHIPNSGLYFYEHTQVRWQCMYHERIIALQIFDWHGELVAVPVPMAYRAYADLIGHLDTRFYLGDVDARNKNFGGAILTLESTRHLFAFASR